VQLLYCFAVPVCMIVSRVLFQAVFSVRQTFGCLFCLAGAVMLVVSDLLSRRNGETEETAILGDALVVIGVTCGAISNVAEEHLVKNYDRVEFLGMLGLCGFVVSLFQVSALELQTLRAIDWTDVLIWVYLLSYVVCLFLIYCFVPLLLQNSSAVFLNLSYLTSNFYGLFVAMIIFSASLHFLYFLAFSIIIVGLTFYNFKFFDPYFNAFFTPEPTPMPSPLLGHRGTNGHTHAAPYADADLMHNGGAALEKYNSLDDVEFEDDDVAVGFPLPASVLGAAKAHEPSVDVATKAGSETAVSNGHV